MRARKDELARVARAGEREAPQRGDELVARRARRVAAEANNAEIFALRKKEISYRGGGRGSKSNGEKDSHEMSAIIYLLQLTFAVQNDPIE